MLDVSLSRNGLTRYWLITKWAERWSCSYTEGHCVKYGACGTLALAQAKKAEWEQEIASARANGWADHHPKTHPAIGL